jgi:hypothetical protein
MIASDEGGEMCSMMADNGVNLIELFDDDRASLRVIGDAVIVWQVDMWVGSYDPDAALTSEAEQAMEDWLYLCYLSGDGTPWDTVPG